MVVILGNPRATSRDDAIFSGESLLKVLKSPWELILTEPVPEVVEFRSADWAEKYFSSQSADRNSTTSGTGSVRISSQGLFSTLSKLSPENIASSRLVAPGFPRMCGSDLESICYYRHYAPLLHFIQQVKFCSLLFSHFNYNVNCN